MTIYGMGGSIEFRVKNCIMCSSRQEFQIIIIWKIIDHVFDMINHGKNEFAQRGIHFPKSKARAVNKLSN